MIDFYKLTGTNSHYEFETKLRDYLESKEDREDFYRKLTIEKVDDQKDLFLEYFEMYAAERKTNKQDYTPHEVADLLAYFSETEEANAIYDGAAGTGALLIAKWNKHKDSAEYFATEYADNVIPYLLHNLAFRNMKATINHGDTITQEIKKSYKLTPQEGGYSEIQT